MELLVTGGAGFIGSHLVDALIEAGHSVVCLDDLSLGRMENIKRQLDNPDFKFIQLDVNDEAGLNDVFNRHRFACVFHLVANSDVQKSAQFPRIDLERTFMSTFNVLEGMKNHGVKQIVFTSSSAIYGELNEVLHEDSGPLFPISFYGAAKLSSEAFISAFCDKHDMRSWIIRFPNVVGERATHGVVFDFINRLNENPQELFIFGDGTQEKPYVYVKNLTEGIVYVWQNATEKINYFNLGVDSCTTVSNIAAMVCEEMGLKNVKLNYTGGDRGWAGDVPKYNFDVAKINSLGWKAARSSDEAVRLSIRAALGKEI